MGLLISCFSKKKEEIVEEVKKTVVTDEKDIQVNINMVKMDKDVKFKTSYSFG